VSTYFVTRFAQNIFWIAGHENRLATSLVDTGPNAEFRARFRWLPGMESNHDKTSQSRLCYHYTTRQWKTLKADGERRENGAGDGIRTRNRLFTKQVLYH
jgi:hypothetical protein